jgi:hypothetical protein
MCFVSYSRTELFYVYDLVHNLHAHDIETWVDFEQLTPGADWNQQISAAITSTPVFLVILSRGALTSENVQLECRQAIDEGKRICAILFEHIRLPSYFAEAVVIDGSGNFDDLIKRLVELLQGEQPWHGGPADTMGRQFPHLRFKFGTLFALWFFPILMSLVVSYIALFMLVHYALPAFSDAHTALNLVSVILLSCWAILFYVRPPLAIMRRKVAPPLSSAWRQVGVPTGLLAGYIFLIGQIAFKGPTTIDLTGIGVALGVAIIGYYINAFPEVSLLGTGGSYDEAFKRFLVPGGEPGESKYDRPITFDIPHSPIVESSSSGSHTFSLHHAAHDETAARKVRDTLISHGLISVGPTEVAQYHIGLISNLTTVVQFTEWMSSYPTMIWVICSSIRVPVREIEFRRRQWVDFRSRREEIIRSLAFSLITGRLSQPIQIGSRDLSRVVLPESIRGFCRALRFVAQIYLVGGVLAVGATHSLLVAPPLLFSCLVTLVNTKTKDRTLSRRLLRIFRYIERILALGFAAFIFALFNLFLLFLVPLSLSNIVLFIVFASSVVLIFYIINDIPFWIGNFWFGNLDHEGWLPDRTAWVVRWRATLGVPWSERVAQADTLQLLLVGALVCASLPLFV